MTQIHHVLVTHEDRWVVDPALGPVKRREQVTRASTVERLVHNGKTYEVQPDGTFDVPDDLAQFQTSRPGWFYGPSPFAPEVSVPKRRRSKEPWTEED